MTEKADIFKYIRGTRWGNEERRGKIIMGFTHLCQLEKKPAENDNHKILNPCLNSTTFKLWLFGLLRIRKLLVWVPSLVILLLNLVNHWEFLLILLFSLAKDFGSSQFGLIWCETILQPGFNCTIRIEKNKAKRKRRNKVMVSAKNNAVYTCHFCLHRNLKRGTPKGYVKEIAPSRVINSINESVSSAIQRGITVESNSTSNATMDKANAMPLPAVSNSIDFPIDSPANPTATTGVKLLDSKRKRKKQGYKKSGDEALISSASAEIAKASGTSKRRKKSWTTLKEITENEENERNKRFTNFSIPFVL